LHSQSRSLNPNQYFRSEIRLIDLINSHILVLPIGKWHQHLSDLFSYGFSHLILRLGCYEKATRKKRNRARNAGGVPVDSYKTGLAMATLTLVSGSATCDPHCNRNKI